MRLVNTECARAGLKFIQQCDNSICFRSTMVFCSCSVCDSPKYNYMCMPQDLHPQRCIHYCDKWKCHADTLSSLLRIFRFEHVYPWIKWYPINKDFPVLRSSGEYSKGTKMNNIFYIDSKNPLIALKFTTNCYKNKVDVYNDNKEYELYKTCPPSNIDIKDIKGIPCFLSLLPEARCLFVPYVYMYNVIITNKINIKFKISFIVNPELKNM